MILAENTPFSREHFERHKGVAPAHLCELVVHCLELVAQLANAGLAFRFKGGNSLLILLEDPQRFSIDVDIVTLATKEELTALVEGIVERCDVFTRYEVRQHKTKPWLPMISYKLFFRSSYQAEEDAFVMLDAVLEPPPYEGVRKPVRCGALYGSSVEVEVPSVSGLIADKLLCIGPSTMGIPLGKKKEAQRLKHVFDVALLTRHPHDEASVKVSLERCMAQENRIQKSSWSKQDVAADTARFLGEPLRFEHKPDPATLEPGSYLDEIVRGFDEFRTYLFRMDYSWPRFQEDCRAAAAIMAASASP